MTLRVPIQSLLVSACLAVSVQAAERLWPTQILWTPDACTSFEQVTLREKSEFASGVEVGRCLAGQSEDSKSQSACLKEAQSGELLFLSNKCSGGWFVSINGIEYSLKKLDLESGRYLSHEDVVEMVRQGRGGRRNAPDLVGNFQGDGVSVRVTQPRLIKKTVDANIAPPDDPVLDNTFAVTVHIRKGNAEKAFPAVLKANYK